MLRNYIKIIFRNALRQKGYSFINISSLALGMACCLIIMLWVLDELSYDRFNENAESLYRVEQDQNYSGEWYHVNVTPYPMGPALKEEIPEVIDASRVVNTGSMLFRSGEKVFFENGIVGIDPSFFSMFTFPLIKGNENTVLNDPMSVVVSEEIADKYFGGEDPLGKVFTVNNEYEIVVTGVAEKVPNNSELQFDILVPYEFLRAMGSTNDSWTSNSILTFVQLHENSSILDVNEKISAIRHRHAADDIQERNPEFLEEFNRPPRVEFSVMPLTNIHLHAYFGFGRPMGAIQYVYIFSVIALFVLLIACINFMNLSTARSANRAKEIGMRKVVGALKGHIIKQFYSESVFYALTALLFSLLLVVLFLPTFNTLSGKELSFNITGSGAVLIGLLGITVFTGIVAGSYPALYLSSFRPVNVLKGSLQSGAKSSAFRKALVVLQFSLSIFLIIGTGIVYNQSQFMKNKKLGFEKEQLLYIVMRGDTGRSYNTLKNELQNDSRILGVTGMWQRPPFIGSNSSGADWDGKDPDQDVLIGMNFVDFDFTESLKIEMKEGRSFSREFPTDTATAFLVNEEVEKIMGKESAVGENFNFLGKEGKIIGVMKNFHFKPVREIIEPIALAIQPSAFRYAFIRIQAQDVSSTIDYIHSAWNRIIPNYPFDYYFLDESYDRLYRAEERMGDLLKYFAILAVLIACLGLFGLASFTAEQRTKEIGIRKVLGATAPNIIVLLCGEFLKLVLISNIIAWPAAWYVMNSWQQEYAYRAGISSTIFLFAGTVAVIIALLTVSFQAVKAALSNPVQSLKYE